MPKYRVQFVATASSVVEVEADDLDDARDKAEEAFERPNLCAQCSGWGQDTSMDLSDWEPYDGDDGFWLADQDGDTG